MERPLVSGLLDLPEEHASLIVAGQIVNLPATSREAGLRAVWDHVQAGTLDTLRGSFIIAIRYEAQLYLIRDGAGKRTVYYGKMGDRWLFAIEPKAIHTQPGFTPELRREAVAEFLSFSFIPGERTMLKDIYELPAGHAVSLSAEAEPTLDRWFRPEDYLPETHLQDEHWEGRFNRLFSDAIDELRQPGKPGAVFLSGGIDSSIVTAALAKQSDDQIRTFAVHFGKKYPNELNFAREVAKFHATDHEEVLVRPKNFVPKLRKIVWAMDEPVGDPVAMPNHELAAHVAGEGFDRVFNGEGGDPLFGGPKNMPMLLSHWYGGQDFTSGFRERAYLGSYRRAYEELDVLLTPEYRVKSEALESILTPFFEAERHNLFLDRLIETNVRLKGAHLILPKVERMLAQSRMMPLSPLFDERLIQLAYQLPPHLKLQNGIEKVILKNAFRGRLPDEVIDRPKSGMRVPVHYWFRGEMKSFAKKLLSREALLEAGIFDPDRVKQLLRYEAEGGPGRFGIRLWMLVTFEIWRRLVLEREPV